MMLANLDITSGASQIAGVRAQAGASQIAGVRAQAGASQIAGVRAQAGYVKPRSFRAVYRQTANNQTWANSALTVRQIWMVIAHNSNINTTVTLRHVWLALQSTTVAAVITLDLVRVTPPSLTQFLQGGLHIIPSPMSSLAQPILDFQGFNSFTNSTCLVFGGSTFIENGTIASTEFNIGITGAASITNPPPFLPFRDLLAPAGYGANFSQGLPVIHPGVDDGFAIVSESTATTTLTGITIIDFTEE